MQTLWQDLRYGARLLMRKSRFAAPTVIALLLASLFLSAVAQPDSPLVNLTQNSGGDFEPMWSPDGKRIVFYSNRNAPAKPRFQIFVINTDGSGEIKLPGSNEDFRPVWSPDGKRFAFDSYRDGNHEIYVVNADGSHPRRLTNDPAYDSSPRWSPDGKKLVYFSGPESTTGKHPYGDSDIWVMNADGSSKVKLTQIAGDDTYPFWSPDGKQIAFTSYRDGNPEIYVMKVDGSQQKRLTNNPARDDNARWAPDGKKISFGSNRDGNYEVYVMNADGSAQANLTRHPADDVDAAWSPDGKKIAFASKRDGDYDIYLMSVAAK